MNIYLIGYRGSGKTTVAPLLAEQLQWKFTDTDQQIELLAGCSIAEIFSEYDETTFRQWETTVLEALSMQSNQVISLGGGAPMLDYNQELIINTGFTVWLKADPEVLWQRISSDSNSASQRPNLTDEGGLDEVRTVLTERAPIYEACADFTIDTEGFSPKHIAQQIANWYDPVDK